MSVEVLEAESDIYRQYDRALSELSSSVEVATLGPDLRPEVQPDVEAAVRQFLAGELVRQGHAKLRAQGVSDDVLPDEGDLGRSLELDLLSEPDREALEGKLRDFAAQTIRDPEGGGETPEGGEPGALGPTPSPKPAKPIISALHTAGHSCIHAYSGIPGARMNLISPLPTPPPGRNFVTLGIVGIMPTPYGVGAMESGDGLRAIIDDGAPFRLQPSQMLVSLASTVPWAKEIVAWNAVRGRLSSVYQPGPSTVPTTMLLTHDCEGAGTIIFRAPKAFGNWWDLFHFDPTPFWPTFGGRRLAFTWTMQ